ncbi:hypothetical protein I4F81_004018 [Pyropia yezoensis]|uniref:Uncharacterized protein n=1 Tax=Pyropia yezoensis TaxID=2788 RepID=A0ACC3BU18_PYRYE|nr:hypothetical protein I4F81_004018 [Neopyropia yezoensis]
MALSPEFCAHATSLAATITAVDGDVCCPEFHRPADSLPTFSVLVFTSYARVPQQQEPPEGFFPLANVSKAGRSALRLQLAIMEADDYPLHFLAAVTAVPHGIGVEHAVGAAEGAADSGTLGGALLATLRRVAATGDRYPFAWCSLGGSIAELAAAWLAAGLVRPSEAGDVGGRACTTNGMLLPLQRPVVPSPVPPSLPRPAVAPASSVEGDTAPSDAAATNCAACTATRMYRHAETLGSFGYHVALGSSSTPTAGGGGAVTATYDRLITGVSGDGLAAAAPTTIHTDAAATGTTLPVDGVPQGTRSSVHTADWAAVVRDLAALACLVAALRSQPAAVDLLLYLAGVAAEAGNGSALDPSPPFLPYPGAPPFVRLLRPRMVPWAAGGGGHLTAGGSLCLAALTPARWAPSTGLLELLLAVRAAVGDPHPVAARVDPRRAADGYGLGEALAAYARVGEAHGWLPRGRGRDAVRWVGQ